MSFLQALDSESARAAIQGALPATIPDPKPGSRSLRQDPVVAAIAREVRLFNRELEAWREESGKARPLQEDTVKTLRLRRDALAAAVRAGGGKSMRLWLPAFRSPQVRGVLKHSNGVKI